MRQKKTKQAGWSKRAIEESIKRVVATAIMRAESNGSNKANKSRRRTIHETQGRGQELKRREE